VRELNRLADAGWEMKIDELEYDCDFLARFRV
jgi:hypothetical protein